MIGVSPLTILYEIARKLRFLLSTLYCALLMRQIEQVFLYRSIQRTQIHNRVFWLLN